jgi:hypothetical protein
MDYPEVKELVDYQVGANPDMVLGFLEALESAVLNTADYTTKHWKSPLNADDKLGRAWRDAAREIGATRMRVYDILKKHDLLCM